MEKLVAPSGYSDICSSKTIKPEVVGRLTKCSHAFHILCMLAMYTNGNKVLGLGPFLHMLWWPQWLRVGGGAFVNEVCKLRPNVG